MKNKSAIEVLTNLQRRPTTQEALGLLETDILKAAREINFPVQEDKMERVLGVQKKFLPLLESLTTQLLMENEKDNSTYYPLARDCEFVYDALSGLSLAGKDNLGQRLHLLKTSQGMQSKKRVNPEYFHQIGITQERIENGHPLVFIDSGFIGTLIEATAEWSGIESVPNKNFRGYLVALESGLSKFKELKLYGKAAANKRAFTKAMKNSPYEKFIGLYGFSYLMCAFMQVAPKFTGRYVQTYQRNDGQWDVMPEQNQSNAALNIKSNKACIKNEYGQKNSIETIRGEYEVNSDVVHPASALLLQKRTLEYFANPKTQNRIDNRIAKNN